MDAIVKTPVTGADNRTAQKPSREEAEKAVRTIIEWIGDDPAREGLIHTPSRVVRAFEELYSGYGLDAGEKAYIGFESFQNRAESYNFYENKHAGRRL